MHRTQIVAGNWKMHKNPRQAGEFVEALGVRLRERPDLAAPLAEGKVELALFPTALCLADAMRARREIPVTLGAQNAHWETHGAFTGEMGAGMFADMGCGYILIGHSERRAPVPRDRRGPGAKAPGRPGDLRPLSVLRGRASGGTGSRLHSGGASTAVLQRHGGP